MRNRGAFDNAKKYVESGMLPGHGKGSAAHKATVANTLAVVIRQFTLIK